MKKNLYNYIKSLDDVKNEDIDKTIEELLINISFFQHERFVHLIVTVFVGIITMMVFLFYFLIENLLLIVLGFILLCLFVPYIFHYYYLENGVQELYRIYWKLKETKSLM